MTGDAVYAGVLFMLAGATLGLWKRKRVFDRTNAFGVERFPGYWHQLGARTNDIVLGGTSSALLVTGLLVLARRYEDSWGWVVLLAAYGLLFALLIGVPINLGRKRD